MTVTQTKTLKEYFSLASVEKLSQRFGDPAWLRAARLKGWEAYEQGLKEGRRNSGAKWLEEPGKAPEWGLEPGAKAALPQAWMPALEGEWGELSGAHSYGCEESAEPLLDAEAKKAGVIFCSLKEALKSHEALVKERLFTSTQVDDTIYTGLHAAYFSQGSFLYVPKGVKLAKPLYSRGAHTGGHAGFFPHTLAVLAEGAEATLVDEWGSATAGGCLAAGVSELFLGAGARLNYISFQDLNLASGAVGRQNTVLASEARLYTLGLVRGAAWSTSFLGTKLQGGGAFVDLLGLALGRGHQLIEIRTLQDHVGRSADSDALVKSILRDSAHFYFDGVVKIYKSGQNSNAFQSNPNLLLSPKAKAESVPTLEIEADDVACKHAASIGSIDEEEKFYLLSRGIPLKDTEDIITEGFAAELASRLPEGQVQERFEAILNRLSHAPA